MASHTNKCVQEEEDLATMTEIINREIVDRPKASNGTKSRAVGVVAWQVLATHSFYVLSEGGPPSIVNHFYSKGSGLAFSQSDSCTIIVFVCCCLQ